MQTEKQKKYLYRASRARSELLKEKKKYGFIRDGSGKRYRACVYFVLGGATLKAADSVTWFEKEFPDDVGEPTFNLFAALAYHRSGNPEEARQYLLSAMLSNIYLLPFLYSEPLSKQDMWHSSNHQSPDYLQEIVEFLSEPTDEERAWFKAQFESNPFSMIRNKYIETFRALQHTKDLDQRGRILSEWYQYESAHP